MRLLRSLRSSAFARVFGVSSGLALSAVALGCGAAGEGESVSDQEQFTTALPGDYESKRAREKQALLWKNVVADEYCAARASGPSRYDLRALREMPPPEDERGIYADVVPPAGLAAAAPEASYMSAACDTALAATGSGGGTTMDRVRSAFTQSAVFDHSADEMPSARRKIIHTEGSAAAVVFQTVNSMSPRGFGQPPQWLRHTGLLAPRQQIPGILRVGEVGVPLGDPIMGMGLKLFVDGQPSRNIHAMTRINGQEDIRDPFRLPMTNMLLWNEGTHVGIVAVLKTLQLVKPDSLQVPIDHFARVTPDGRDLLQNVSYPHEVAFLPEPRIADLVHALLAANPTMDLRQAFRAIPVGSVLYRVTARRNEPGGVCNEFAEIGRIVLASPLVASQYEDLTLYFRHNRGKWREEGGRSVPWVSGESDRGTTDVNEENRTLVTQDCTN